jgi:hypothetical protein
VREKCEKKAAPKGDPKPLLYTYLLLWRMSLATLVPFSDSLLGALPSSSFWWAVLCVFLPLGPVLSGCF